MVAVIQRRTVAGSSCGTSAISFADMPGGADDRPDGRQPVVGGGAGPGRLGGGDRDQAAAREGAGGPPLELATR
jgi:hypothetical protein